MPEASTYSATLQHPTDGARVLDVAPPGDLVAAMTAARRALFVPEGAGVYIVEDSPEQAQVYPDIAESTLDNPRRVVLRRIVPA